MDLSPALFSPFILRQGLTMSPRLVLNTRYVAEARVSVDLMAGIRGLINPFNLILLSIVMLVAEEAFGC